jgi:hypothetical protein
MTLVIETQEEIETCYRCGDELFDDEENTFGLCSWCI